MEHIKIGDCPICTAVSVPVRLFRADNKMVAWFCDPCLEKYRRGKGGGGIVTRGS